MIEVRSETAIHVFNFSLLFFLYILLNFVLLQLLCVLPIKPKIGS